MALPGHAAVGSSRIAWPMPERLVVGGAQHPAVQLAQVGVGGSSMGSRRIWIGTSARAPSNSAVPDQEHPGHGRLDDGRGALLGRRQLRRDARTDCDPRAAATERRW